MKAKQDAAVTECAYYELQKARAKHADMHSAHEGYAVILEELDELKAEVWMRDHDVAAMRKEALHVAAMALRFVVDVCDRSHDDE